MFCVLKIITLPIFEPNEYFWKHHQKEGEEKWETYMRTLRQIMSDASGLPLSDNCIEDRNEYRKILFPPKDKKD